MFLCAFIPVLPVQAILRSEPVETRAHLEAAPLVILEGEPPHVHVAAVNSLATRAGLGAGMTKLQAEACPGVVMRRRTLAQEAAAQAALLDCMFAISPRVESTAAGTALADISGCERLFGSVAQAAHELARRIADTHLAANIAVAGNPDSAMYAARGFAGITLIAAGTEGERLGDLPITLLCEGDEYAETLETIDSWGVHTFRGFAGLPPLALSERIGQHGMRLQRLARGIEQRELKLYEPEQRFEEAAELEEAIELLDPLAFVLSSLLDNICARLRTRSLGAHALDLRLELEVHTDIQRDAAEQAAPPSPIYTRRLTFPVPMQEKAILLRLLQLELRAHPPAAPIKKIWIRAEAAKPRTTQHSFFVPLSPESAQLEVTLARLRAVVGDKEGDRVGSPQLVDSHRDDHFRMARFVASGKPATEPPRGIVAAMRQYRPPIPCAVELHDGRPCALRFRGEAHSVKAVCGPWRSSGEWWSERRWARDEWDVVTDATAYRIYRDALNGHWYVDGSYD